MILSTLAFIVVATPPTGQALMDSLSKKAFDYFWNESDAVTGLTKDRAGNFATDSNTVASVAATGYALAAYSVGITRGYVNRQNALTRTRLTLKFLTSSQAARQKGWYYHFVDMKTGARVWSSEVSSIDSAILFAGALMADQAFKDPVVSAYVSSMMKAVDWKWMLTDGGTRPGELLFSMGWTPESGFIDSRWSTLSEESILYIEALGTWQSMPVGSWAAIGRPLLWYGGVQVVQGGPLFMHEMSQGFLPMYGKRDSLGFDYSVEMRNMLTAQRTYCTQNPNNRVGYSNKIWGLSAGDTPTGYQACGAPGWGVDDGTLNPACMIAGMQVDPTNCQAAANAFSTTYPQAFGRYGWSNGINPTANWIGSDVIGIDLGVMLLGIENWRSGYPAATCGDHPIMQIGMKRAGFRSTVEGAFATRYLIQ